MLACIRCGLCLTSCPTYVLTLDESEGPRGRVGMARALAEGHLDVTPDLVEHELNCLVCDACTAVCPAGVHMDPLQVALRSALESASPRRSLVSPTDPAGGLRLAVHGPGQVSAAGAVAVAVPAARRALVGAPPRHPASARPRKRRKPAARTSAGIRPSSRRGVRRLTHCYRIARNEAQRRYPGGVLRRVRDVHGPGRHRSGHDPCAAARGLRAPQSSQPGLLRRPARSRWRFNSRDGPGKSQHRRVRTDRRPDRREFGRLRRDAQGLRASPAPRPRVVRRGKALLGTRARLERSARRSTVADCPRAAAKVVLQDACHLLHAQRVSRQPRDLLRRIPGLALAEIDEAGLCCGSAGVYNVTNPVQSRQLQQRKLDNALAPGPAVIVTTNPGCLLQLKSGLAERGSPVRVKHLAEVLDEASRP